MPQENVFTTHIIPSFENMIQPGLQVTQWALQELSQGIAGFLTLNGKKQSWH